MGLENNGEQPMRAKGVSWVGVKTTSFQAMRTFFGETMGLGADYEHGDFVVFRLPNGDKFEIFGPSAGEPAQQFANNQVMTSFLVDDIHEAVAELQAAGIELVGERQESANGYSWQHFRAPDGKLFELACDPLHP